MSPLHQFTKMWNESFHEVSAPSEIASPLPDAPPKTTEVRRKGGPYIQFASEIDKITTINGLTIEEIERRARPYSYSMSGFLDSKERFKEILKSDWEYIRRMQVTHTELAAHLRSIVKIFNHVINTSSTSQHIIEYDPSSLDGNSLASRGSQRLQIQLINLNKRQRDLFSPNDETLRDVSTPEDWKEEYKITSLTNRVELYINEGVLRYIEEFGFYEGGGDENRFRVDPRSIVNLLKGNVEPPNHDFSHYNKINPARALDGCEF